jgi:molecular chaperone DnaK
MREPVIGIDLGTTFSAVASVVDGRPEIVLNRDSKRLTPSMVGFTERGDRLVGDRARLLAEDMPENVVFAAKRFIGRRWSQSLADQAKELVPYGLVAGPNGEVRIRIAGRTLPVTQISAMILGELRLDAESHFGKPVHQAVVTVPANFDDGQRNATKEAARIAGLEVLRILNEPTAAAVAYGLDRGFQGRALVFDLGGGTFDVSILEVQNGVFEVRATGGDPYLGGEDFDNRIVQWLLAQVAPGVREAVSADPLSMQRLKVAAEKAKRTLSTAQEAHIAIAGLGDHRDGRNVCDLQTALTRDFFDAVSQPLSERCMDVCKQVMLEAKVEPSAVDAVLLVGGMTRVPMVRRLVSSLFGREPVGGVNPDEVVALGAAIHAHEIAQRSGRALLIDVAAQSLGVGVLGGRVRKLIAKNTTIPVSVREIFLPGQAGQTRARIPIYQGESDEQDTNHKLGELVLRELNGGERASAPIEVVFELASDATLSVRATDLKTGQAEAIRIEARPQLAPGEEQRLAREEAAYAQQRSAEDAKGQGEHFERLLQKAERLVRILQRGAQDHPTDEARATVSSVQTLVDLGRAALAAANADQIAEVRVRLARFVN